MRPSIILYQASAGSGKTFQIALSYLSLLKESSSQSPSFKDILAITFTNKAVYEMKERIIKFLKQIALESEEGKRLSELTGITPKRAEEILEEIFLHYDYLEIKTIDSFLLKFFRGLAYELDLHPHFSIKEYIGKGELEKALIRLYLRSQNEPNIKKFFERFVDFLLSAEDKLRINMKGTILRNLEELLKMSTYEESLLLARSLLKEDIWEKEAVQSKDSLSLKRGNFYLYLLFLLKEELERVLFEEGAIYMGLWKEKLAQSLHRDFLPWIYLKLGKLRAFIIDEFQDTDRLQWLAIYPLVEDLISDGRIFITAGDPKQSIYRWKGGDPSLLRRLKEDLAPYDLVENSLKCNHRSCLRIVKFNNYFFEVLKNGTHKRPILQRLLFGRESDKVDEALLDIAEREFLELFENIEQESHKDLEGKVFIDWLVFNKEASQQEVQRVLWEHIAKILTDLKEKRELEGIAILCRENKQVTQLSSYLTSLGFSVQGSSFLKLKESPLVNYLTAFIRLLYDLDDEIALFTLLLGFFEEGNDILQGYLNFLGGADKAFTLRDYLQNYWEEFWEKKIKHPLEKGAYLNLYQFVRHIIDYFKVEERFPQEKPYLYKFLSLVLRFVSQGGDGDEFLENCEPILEEDIETSPEKSFIRVLNIHLAKGLEFEKVIVPLDFTPKSFRLNLGFLFTEEGVHKGKKEEFTPDLLRLYNFIKISHSLEVFNLLYVAFTRAIRYLYILVPHGLKRNFLAAEIFIRTFELLKEQGLDKNISHYFEERFLAPHNGR